MLDLSRPQPTPSDHYHRDDSKENHKKTKTSNNNTIKTTPCNWLLIIPYAQTIKFDLLTRSLVWRLRFVCCHKPCQATATTTTIVVGQTCPLCPLTFRPPPNLEVPHAHLKSIWECPKINKIGVELENGKIQAGWRCEWCQFGDQMFKTAHGTKALAHVLSLPRCDICACKDNISKSYMISYRDLYQRITLANKECNSMTGDMTDSINEMQVRMASDIQLSWHNQMLMNKMYVWYILICHLFAFLFV